ncbi:MAG: PilT/PilU family type 4a pilus ATPase [Chromatiaceae bacterium]|nr:PilT/PilU family type 4a pilus ATPase [Gammaproteobacteria bacterium]MCP5317795.1 PilT/PilU family type 4a pilus ATPase [Chromatiaceae bacterium]MCW5586237.1 PilT/PilU family type 4a pilus ATPase [Chromatiales bacterium]MCP5429190.1 PilT/PilU family type 4a pilus ATPase [Chromatiaceae bacterium]MCP5434733.1 PilT/PilU family type 4a pilus ATPase [Chromatiaceae bacterium]
MDFNDILDMMVQKKASDLFITADIPPSIKVHGRIMPVSKTKLDAAQTRELTLSLMTPEQRDEFLHTKECNFAFSAKNVGRFRVSAFVQRDSVGMVLRRIETRIPNFEELGLPHTLHDLAMANRGIVFFVGATGTGKSTSLAAMVGYRNQNSTGHIISIEDPIEFLHNHAGCIVTQREVGLDTESYEVALKNTLRQAPDVILIGEVRTRQAMEHAITFAETGHLVLTTLHANNANQALDRILHFFPEEQHDQILMDLSLNLRGIVAQQLIRRPDGNGRRAIMEVMLNTPLVSDLILKGEVHKLKELMKRSTEHGMITFDQALYDAYRRGEITQEDALRHADSSNEVRLMIKLGDTSPNALNRDAGKMSFSE